MAKLKMRVKYIYISLFQCSFMPQVPWRTSCPVHFLRPFTTFYTHVNSDKYLKQECLS